MPFPSADRPWENTTSVCPTPAPLSFWFPSRQHRRVLGAAAGRAAGDTPGHASPVTSPRCRLGLCGSRCSDGRQAGVRLQQTGGDGEWECSRGRERRRAERERGPCARSRRSRGACLPGEAGMLKHSRNPEIYWRSHKEHEQPRSFPASGLLPGVGRQGPGALGQRAHRTESQSR